uniref:Tyr recombinase domain-containing protein n=1 Tax=Amphimedon queenslandica TaxID=400682 RepID=A0A1X7VTH6_AMPQE
MSKPPTLADVRLVAVALLAYAAFLRYDELSKLRCCDIKFHSDHMIVFISSSKTDQYMEGARLTVARARIS